MVASFGFQINPGADICAHDGTFLTKEDAVNVIEVDHMPTEEHPHRYAVLFEDKVGGNLLYIPDSARIEDNDLAKEVIDFSCRFADRWGAGVTYARK